VRLFPSTNACDSARSSLGQGAQEFAVFAEDHIARFLKGQVFSEPRLDFRILTADNSLGEKNKNLPLLPGGQSFDLLHDFSGAHATNLPQFPYASKPESPCFGNRLTFFVLRFNKF
jgi:hypothetical protein